MALKSRASPDTLSPSRSGRGASSVSTKSVASLFFGAPDPTILFAADGGVLALNDAALETGSPRVKGGDRPPERFLPFWADEEGRERLRAEGAAGAKNLEVRAGLDGDSPERTYWVSVSPCPDAGEGCFIATAREVTERCLEAERLRLLCDDLALQVERDPLTGFLNRQRFRQELEREVARSNGAGSPLVLVTMGLDRFKSLNDTHGQGAGDEYLRVLGEALRSVLGNREHVARVGGDEIVVLFPGRGAAEASASAEWLLSFVRGITPSYEGTQLNLTASVGVAVFPDHAASAADLVRAADLAMHRAKGRGGARYLLHDPENPERDRISHLREQADRTRTALAEASFVPFFQPVAEIKTGRIVAVETLARMRLPDGTFAKPDQFLDAAERFGFVTQIDRVVIAAAFEALVSARRRVSPDLEMAINLSGLDFEDDSLVADISRLARAKGIRPERIAFEITETAVLRDLARVQHFTRALTGEGFRFALDDFGIGFSSFRYLRELPVSSLKLDMSYVQNLPTAMENRVFVRGMVEICHGLGVKTVAEGVETQEVLDLLSYLGVDRAQGYFIGYPSPELPAAESDPVKRPRTKS